jgi:lysozyme-like protein
MRWTLAPVIGFAQSAGFRRAALIEAAAVAFATSQGEDTYHREVMPGPVEDEQGLWGIDLVRWPEYVQLNLYDPNVNARCARAIYLESGRTWDWSPVWGSNTLDGLLVEIEQYVKTGAPVPFGTEARYAVSADPGAVGVRLFGAGVVASVQDVLHSSAHTLG